jgi:hypothetical protein
MNDEIPIIDPRYRGRLTSTGMTDLGIAEQLRLVSMGATAFDLLCGRIDRATVVERLRRDSYGPTDARSELATAIEAGRREVGGTDA